SMKKVASSRPGGAAGSGSSMAFACLPPFLAEGEIDDRDHVLAIAVRRLELAIAVRTVQPIMTQWNAACIPIARRRRSQSINSSKSRYTIAPSAFDFRRIVLSMKPIAPGTVIFHRHRGYGVITAVNLMPGWISARFGNEMRTLDLNLSSDEVQHADGEPILFRRAPPDQMPHARLMAMVRQLHQAGYQRLYLYSWPKPSGLHWRWHLFTGPRNWMERPWREGWYGSGADYIFNPVMGWGDAPGETTEELVSTLAQFDPVGMAQALG